VALICDTGPLYAALDRDDAYHEACSQLLATFPEPLVVPAPVAVEVDWLSANRLGPSAFVAFLEDVQRGMLGIVDLTDADYARVRDLLIDYEDFSLGFVDASVLAVAERLGETKLATLDHRHFGALRPRHTEALELLPA
jgi:predicted nucleic acid-binding protein